MPARKPLHDDEVSALQAFAALVAALKKMKLDKRAGIILVMIESLESLAGIKPDDE